MNTYAVKYLDGTELEVAYIQGENQENAKNEFVKIFPDIDLVKILSISDIQEQTTDYGAAIKIAKIMTILGWIAVIAGVLMTLSMMFISMGIQTIISGFMLIMGSQITRATADNANYSKQMLDEMRNRK